MHGEASRKFNQISRLEVRSRSLIVIELWEEWVILVALCPDRTSPNRDRTWRNVGPRGLYSVW